MYSPNLLPSGEQLSSPEIGLHEAHRLTVIVAAYQRLQTAVATYPNPTEAQAEPVTVEVAAITSEIAAAQEAVDQAYNPTDYQFIQAA